MTSNPVGKPLIFKTVEELQAAVDQYFDECDNRMKEIHTKEGEAVAITVPEPYTMSGLAYALGISRQTLIDYENRDEYVDTIKRARARVERDVERRLLEGTSGAAGPIFNLKNNFGWKDKKELEATVKDERKEILGKYLGGEDVERTEETQG